MKNDAISADAAGWRRNSALFIIGQFVSMFGTMLVSHSVTWHIVREEQSGVMVAVFACAAMAPLVFISPIAGVWADRYNRKLLINASDAVIALVTLVIAILFTAGHRSIWALLASSVIRSVGQGIQSPAVSALIPQITPKESLARYNGIHGTAQSLILFASPVAAGALFATVPIEYIFYIDVITAIIGVSTVFFFVKAPNPVSSTDKKDSVAKGWKAYWGEIRVGVSYVASQKWLKTMIVASALFGIAASPAALLTPLQVNRSFGVEEWRLPVIEVAFAAGMTVGGVLITVWGGFKNKARTMVLAWLLFAASTLSFGFIPSFWPYVGAMAFCGLSMPIFNTPAYTLLQTKVPAELMGRVFSVLMMSNGLVMPVGIAVFGPLADIVRIETLLIATGCALVIGGFVLSRRKELTEAGAPLIETARVESSEAKDS